MNFKKLSLFLFILVSLFVFSGCGDNIDCSAKDSTYLKYKLDPETETCVISQEIPKNKCGNGVVENGETYCNCADDVMMSDPDYGCQGSLGEYLIKSCDEFTKSCVMTQNEKVVEEIKSLEFSNADLVFSARATYSAPFIINTNDDNKIKFEISLLKFKSTSKKYKNIIVKELRVEDSSSNILGTINYGESISGIGSSLSIKEVGLGDTKKYESKNSLKLKMVVSYNVETYDSSGTLLKTEPKVETLVSYLSSFVIVNPNFYDNN